MTEVTIPQRRWKQDARVIARLQRLVHAEPYVQDRQAQNLVTLLLALRMAGREMLEQKARGQEA